MIPKITIHGRERQPNLVIEYLERLGGRNENHWSGDDAEGYYWIDDLMRIRCTNNIPEGYQFIDDWYNKEEDIKYFLVKWPHSQYFINIKGCYSLYPSINDTEDLDGAMFVPVEIYNKVMNNE